MELSFINLNTMLLHIKLSDVLLALLSLFIFNSLLQRFTNKGPMLWPVMGIVPTFFVHLGNLHDWVTAALIKSGGSFYFTGVWFCGLHGVVTVDPSNIEYILKTRFKNFPKGKYYKERFADLLGDGIFNADGLLWQDQRRTAISEMHSRRFVDYSLQTIQGLVHQKLLKLIEKHVRSGESVDLQNVLLRFTFDNICIAAFGVDPGCLSLDLPDIPFAKAFEEATEFTLFRFQVPPFVLKFLKFFNIASERKLRKAIRIVHEFAEKTVTGRMNETHTNDRHDLLTRLTDVTKYQFSVTFLKDFCISFILAGRDTSSVALAWFFWLIHEHPHVETQILEELSSIIRARQTSESIDDIVFTKDELKKMVYIQAALSESLRLYPSVPIDFKEALEDDILPDGRSVKKGARVLYCIYSMARVEAIWGEDCGEFKPERWIKEGSFVTQNQFKYPVFNAGPRLCLGKEFAYMQMKMLAASVLLRYSVEVVEGHKVVPKLTTTLYMKNGLLVKFKPRLSLKQ